MAFALSQELMYDILIGGKQVGSMLVTKKEVNEKETYYSAVTDVKYTLFRTTELVYFYEAIFKNDTLEKAYFIYKKNDDVEEEAKLFRANESYQSTLPEQHQKHRNPLTKSMLTMYFNQPKHREEIFSERFHDFVKIGATEEKGKYIFYIPNGDKSLYYYNEDGICSKISVSSGLISFDMVLNSTRKD